MWGGAGGSSFFLDAGRGWDSVKVFPKQAPGPQVPFPTSLKPVERVENLSRVGCVCVASGRGRVEDEGCGLPPATARMLILAGVLMCWWKEIKLDQQNLSTETSCLPAPLQSPSRSHGPGGGGEVEGTARFRHPRAERKREQENVYLQHRDPSATRLHLSKPYCFRKCLA